VLYHWRMVEGSTALASGEKSYTTDAGIKALEDHFTALHKSVIVEQGKHENIYKVNWEIKDEPLVSLIIPTYNGYEITKQAIDSILHKSTYRNFEILLVDNNSNDPSALAYFEELGQHDKITVLRYPYPFNYSAINNFAAKKAKGEIIGLINNDVEVITPEWLTEMVSHAQREDIGCVGAMLYFENDTIQHAGVILGIGGVAGHSHKYFQRNVPGYFSRLNIVQNLSAVTAACLLVRKKVFDEVNGLNEEDLTVAFNDVDFCLKVQAAGYRNLWTPYAELYHYESISRGIEDNPAKLARFNKEADYMKETWGTDRKVDPFYSPNLTLTREDFSVGNE
jgi:GT2 family glycosyltransferase